MTEIFDNTQLDALKSDFGAVNVYQHAYGLLPGQIDSLGNPPPYQVSAAIYNNPFTAANSSPLAAQNQQMPGAFGINWQDQGDSMIGDFPSGHTLISTITSLTYAVLAPGYYQQLAQAEADFAYDLNVFGVHYPTDVIGGRILATYVVAETLAGNPLYPSSTGIPANLASLSQAMQGYLGGGASLPYAAPCAGSVAACIAGGVDPQPRHLRPDGATLCLVADLRPAVCQRHDAGAGGADGRPLPDRHTVSLPELRATQPDPGHHRIALGRAARRRLRLGAAQPVRRRERLWRIRQQRHREHERRARRPERVRHLEQCRSPAPAA